MPDVRVSTEADSSGVKAGFNEIRDHVRDVGKDIHSTIAGAFAAGSVVELGRRLLETSEHLEHLSEKFGVSTTALQQWSNAAQLVGISSDSVAGGLNKLEIARSKALGGNEGLTNSFAKLNVTLEDLQSASPDELLKKIGESSLDAADLVKVLGRGALELRPLLQGIAEGSLQLGGAMDEGTVKSLARANRAIKETEQEVTIFFGETLGAGVKAWQQGWNSVGAVILAAKDVIVGSLETINRALHFDFKGALDAAKTGAHNAAEQIYTGAKTNAEIAGGDGDGRPARRPNTAAGGDAGETDDFGNPTGKGRGEGGGGRGNSVETLRERFAKLQEEHEAKQRTNQEQLNTLLKQRDELLKNSAKTNVDDEGTWKTNVALAENQLAIDKAGATIAQEKAKLNDEQTKAREQAADEAEREAEQRTNDLRAAREQTAELREQLAGHDDIAEQMRAHFELQEKINKAVAEGNTALADELKTQQALTAEKEKQERAAEAEARAASQRRAAAAAENARLTRFHEATQDLAENLGTSDAAADPTISSLQSELGPRFGTHGAGGGPSFAEQLIIRGREQSAINDNLRKLALIPTASFSASRFASEGYAPNSAPISASATEEILAELRRQTALLTPRPGGR